MINNYLFTDAVTKVSLAFNRELKKEQAQFLYDQLKNFNDEDVQGAVESLLDGQRLPSLKDWKVALTESHRKNRKDSPIPFGHCPKCEADTISTKCDDDEWYEICTKCDYKEIFYTFSEWKALHGYDGLSILDIANKLRMDRV